MSQREHSPGLGRVLRPWAWIYGGMVAVTGVVSGIIGNRLVALPSYVIGEDFQARLPESGLSQIAVADVYFSIIALVAGLLLGGAAWLLFQRLGWPVTLIACVGALVAGLIAWIVAEFISSRNFAERIATATRGDMVRVDFALHTWVPLAIWVGAAVIPIVLGSLTNRGEWIQHRPSPVPTTSEPISLG